MSAATIWKFRRAVDDEVELRLDGRVVRWLHVESDAPNHITLWAEVVPGLPTAERIFVCGTGHPMDGTERTHIGTVIDGPFVWHVFAADDLEAEDAAAAEHEVLIGKLIKDMANLTYDELLFPPTVARRLIDLGWTKADPK